MERILNYQIQAEYTGLSIKDYLRSLGYSRRIFTHLKQDPESILFNSRPAALYERFWGPGELTVRLTESAVPEKIKPVSLPFPIVYEDEDLLVIDKPADMPIHPSQNNHDNTLANAAHWYFKEQGIPYVYRCINRLDRSTTGLLILAKNMLSSAVLSNQLRSGNIHRVYRAVVCGVPPREGIIDVPIRRAEGSVLERMADPSGGERAVTHYRRLKTDGTYSLLSVTLDTGRTHQIRVHMKHIGCPLPADYLYNPDYRKFKSLPLHSFSLTFPHPLTGEVLHFEREPEWIDRLSTNTTTSPL